MIFVDAHVHIHDCFSIGKFFDAAWENIQLASQRLAKQGRPKIVLMLTEASGANWFGRLRQAAVRKVKISGNWMALSTSEDCSLCLTRDSNQSLFVLAGRQIQAAECLEVLALGLREKFEDGNSVETLVGEVEKAGGIPVIPWGFGKWVGKRGHILSRLLEDNYSRVLCLGDNGGRYGRLREPSHFKIAKEMGMKILPGSDPLPLDREFRRAGSYGFYFDGDLSDEHPARDLKQKLQDPSFVYFSYGNLATFGNFARNQLLIQFKNRLGKKIGRFL